ncbi:hypothetical protein AVEN_185913-1 [Araneus ventricosus]|uniref:RNase H type-1 domain-containing protein n=1 Tax=Araneus ventricosus TaxID=182803 RepID=A0A4Y2FCJ0_ARAVE|nr:hypothetical protein AVEN_185913-1 [Araneus ventricosus]
MLLLTGKNPFQDIMKEKALVLYEKLLRIEDPYWREHIIKPKQLETQNGFIPKVLDFRSDLAIPGDVQPLLKPRNPLEVINVDVKLYLVETIHKKRDVAPSTLRSLALEPIAARYPVTDWLHIFTDGFQFDCNFNVGAGVFSDLSSFYAPVGFIGTAFDGELVAMRIALKQLLAIHHKFENAVLLSDSQAAIQSISSFELPLTPEICQELLRTLTLKGKRIVLQWVPGHCGLWVNEQADFLAKKVANLVQHPNTATSYWKIKLFLKNLGTSNSLRDLQTRTALISWRRVSPSSIPDKPRHDAVAAFRLTTGHDCLAAHLHRLGISAKPFCPLCDSGEVMARDHLIRCGALQGVEILGSKSALGAMTSVFCFCYTFFCKLFLPCHWK